MDVYRSTSFCQNFLKRLERELPSQKCSDYRNERFRSSQAFMGEMAVKADIRQFGLGTVCGGGCLRTSTSQGWASGEKTRSTRPIDAKLRKRLCI